MNTHNAIKLTSTNSVIILLLAVLMPTDGKLKKKTKKYKVGILLTLHDKWMAFGPAQGLNIPSSECFSFRSLPHFLFHFSYLAYKLPENFHQFFFSSFPTTVSSSYLALSLFYLVFTFTCINTACKYFQGSQTLRRLWAFGVNFKRQ